ncbi:hypothetical protein [Staphylococcus carnosus]|uniref:Uncharacterized protein n=1 Tax=Staphylococcus carnosus TaxID=1281 RepID=A0AAJ0JPJ1_STACA|nr:hypothetical protein [Staphylococcus carnosus]KKB25607.1 hypothetical protein VV61_05830 [Staphylococcus carnosus]POA04078.1 hypothetical protein CD153_04185 [Staphylococcus carnosus]QQS84120.1 hypothetical protein I6J04_06595 [Staphylococcus carnosus]QRQ04056.1 hypothetical protein I6J34_06985 [Staphylococcus carnosus]UTB83939.1 hypothetical protein A2I67_12060 [Staphylococcus carnosus]
MYKNIRKIATATIVTSLLMGPVYFTIESGKANAETVKAVDEEMKQRKEIGNVLIESIEENKSSFKDPKEAEILKTKAEQYRDGVAERGRATIAAKAGAKSIKAVVNKVEQKAWDNIIKQVEKRTGTQLVVLHYQSINKLCDYLTGFEGELSNDITKYLVQNGFNRQIAGVIARVFIGVVL